MFFSNAVAPMILADGESDVIALYNATVLIQFQLSGQYLVDHVEWYHNGNILDTRHPRYMLSGSQLSLTVSSLALEDEGNYTISVGNMAGQTEATKRLIVEGKHYHL